MALCEQLEAQLTTTRTDSRRLLKAVWTRRSLKLGVKNLTTNVTF
jgi:hypothetical protein